MCTRLLCLLAWVVLALAQDQVTKSVPQTDVMVNAPAQEAVANMEKARHDGMDQLQEETSSLRQQLYGIEMMLKSTMNASLDHMTPMRENMQQDPSEASGDTAASLRANNERPRSCSDVHQFHKTNGIYTIFSPVCDNGVGMRVFCDMETGDGGWTVVMRRADVAEHEDFNRTWEDYKWGFGNLSGEFWLGNEYIHLLTSMEKMQLRVDLEDWSGETRSASYTLFKVGTSNEEYKLTLGSYSGDARDSFSYSRNAKFSTFDEDNDRSSRNCAVDFNSAWWHHGCTHAALNGPYGRENVEPWHGVIWQHWKGIKYSLKRAEMKIKPVRHMSWCHKLTLLGVKE